MSLTFQPSQTKSLFSILRQIRNYGKSIVFTDDPGKYIQAIKSLYDIELTYQKKGEREYHITH